MTNHYISPQDEDVIEGLINTLERDTGQKIFTMRITGENKKENALEFVAAFETKNMMIGIIKCHYIKGRLAMKVKGNFL
jgi:hypothetical protein